MGGIFSQSESNVKKVFGKMGNIIKSTVKDGLLNEVQRKVRERSSGSPLYKKSSLRSLNPGLNQYKSKNVARINTTNNSRNNASINSTNGANNSRNNAKRNPANNGNNLGSVSTINSTNGANNSGSVSTRNPANNGILNDKHWYSYLISKHRKTQESLHAFRAFEALGVTS